MSSTSKHAERLFGDPDYLVRVATADLEAHQILRDERLAPLPSSIADARSDAWRCFLGNELHDPCFSGGAAFVLCPLGTPDSHAALWLRLTRPLPRGQANPPGDPTRRDPWVIVTAGGAYCYRLTGTSTLLGGRQITYECAGASLLAGSPNRTRPVWTIGLLPTGASKHYFTVGIRSAWW